jgi:hypothetical protein
MKYQALLRQVSINVREQILRGGGDIRYEAAAAALFDAIAEKRNFNTSLAAISEKVSDIIEAWDIRCISRLRNLFPEAFPKTLRKGKLYAEYDENADWCVFSDHLIEV